MVLFVGWQMVQLLSATGGSSLTWIAALHLGTPAALLQVSGGFLLGGIADLDVVHYLLCPSRLGHPRGRTLVLDHVRGSFPIRHAALDANGEFVLTNDRFRQTGTD